MWTWERHYPLSLLTLNGCAHRWGAALGPEEAKEEGRDPPQPGLLMCLSLPSSAKLNLAPLLFAKKHLGLAQVGGFTAESPLTWAKQAAWSGSQLSLLQAGRPWVSVSTSPALGFPICEVRNTLSSEDKQVNYLPLKNIQLAYCQMKNSYGKKKRILGINFIILLMKLLNCE